MILIFRVSLLSTLITLSIITPGFGCGDFPSRDGFEDPATRLTGTTYNPNYGYSVVIPKGLVGYRSAAPAPYHGFGIVLSWEPRSYLYVDGSYNSLDLESLEDVEKTYLEFLKDRSGGIISIQHKSAKLGNLMAKRYIAKHVCPKVSGNFIDDYTLALSKDRGIIYIVALLTTADRYKKDKRVLEEILKSWKLQPIKSNRICPAINTCHDSQMISVDQAKLVTTQRTVQEIADLLGPAADDHCSGIYCPEWHLSDGRILIVPYTDPCDHPIGVTFRNAP